MRSNTFINILAVASLAMLSDGCSQHARSLSDEEFNAQTIRLKSRQAPERVDTELRNVRVFDGFNIGPPTSVFVKDGHIAASGTTADFVIEGEGKFLIPGLIDSHLHIGDLDGLANATSFGLTSVMNMACRNYTQCAPLRNVPGMASWLSAGVPATGPGSNHAIRMNLTDNLLVHPGDDPTEIVANVVANGSDWMKITVEINGPNQTMQTALVGQSHAFGIFSVSHAADWQSYKEAVLSGTDGLQHIPANGPIDPDTLNILSTSGQFVTPTMEIWRIGTSNPVLLQLVQGGQPKDRQAKDYETIIKNVIAVREAGIPVLAGTDSVGDFGEYDIPFGLTLHCELENLVEAGYSPAAALRSATSLPNKYHRLGDRGSIAPGMRADMILLNSNPLDNISNTRDIARIWVEGIEYKDVAKSPTVCADLLNQQSSNSTGA